MISLDAVTKRFGARLAVDNVSLTVPRGGIFGLLGHNGAGKSTSIGMLLGQVAPDAGTVSIAGVDVFADRQRALAKVGAIFETPAFYDYLTGWRNLRLFCEYSAPFDAERGREVVKLVGLEKRIIDRVATYSHGMRQRLALAQALMPKPELLILDEPSEGLDPEGIHEMRNLILRLNREWGLTILFSSHLLSEVQQLCSELAVMHEGKLLFVGNWRELDADRQWVRVQVDRQADAERGLTGAGLVDLFEYDGRGRLAPTATVPQVASWLVAQGFAVQALHPVERTLEDFYLETIHVRDAVKK
ncbi:MAG: Vitamin B12 import ATP-binding protein BtuD [Verrucomicrobiae bacterium]|nr:Vitamin B12 import ATP-binding protein BtuD [Verrucomicrobiae bacterium]